MAAQPRVPALEAASLVPRGDGNSAKEPQTQLAEPASDSKEDSAQAPSAEELLVRWKPYKQNTQWAGLNHPLQPGPDEHFAVMSKLVSFRELAALEATETH